MVAHKAHYSPVITTAADTAAFTAVDNVAADVAVNAATRYCHPSCRHPTC